MTIANRDVYSQYRAHDAAETEYARATNQAMEAIYEIACAAGLKASGDDNAENLVAAIFAYLWDSNHK